MIRLSRLYSCSTPHSLANAVMTSWISSIDLPPLPPLENAKYADIVFTHSSFNAKIKSASSLNLVPGDADMDNEKMEHVGDGLLGATSPRIQDGALTKQGSFVTRLLNEMFPDLKVGAATALKARLVSNPTNALVSSHYGLPSRLRADPSAILPLRATESIQANLLEAYIAGLFYSYLSTSPSSIITPPLTPLKDKPTTSLAALADQPSITASMTHGQATDKLETWLRPLYTSLAYQAYTQMQMDQANARNSDDIEQKAAGATAMLNQHFMKYEGFLPSYTNPPKQMEGMWTCRCTARRRDGSELYALLLQFELVCLCHSLDKVKRLVRPRKQLPLWRLTKSANNLDWCNDDGGP